MNITKDDLLAAIRAMTDDERLELKTALSPTLNIAGTDWVPVNKLSKDLGFKDERTFLALIQRTYPSLLSRPEAARSKKGQWLIFKPGFEAINKTVDLSKGLDALEQRLDQIAESIGETELELSLADE